MTQKFLFPLIILGCTLVFVLPLLLWQGHTANMGSLEPVYLSLAERVAKEGPWGWYPNWYLGFPFRFAGPPATWWILGALNRFTGWDMLFLYRTMMFSALLVFPVSFYFLALKVFGNKSRESGGSMGGGGKIALLAALALILLPSIGYLFPKAFILGSKFGFAPLWMQQDLPRAAGLSLLPICLVFYWRLFEKSTPKRFTTATLCAAVLFLTDGVTALSLLIGTGALLVLEGKEKILRNFTLGAGALITALLLDAFYYTPANLKILAFSPSISGIGLIYFIRTLLQAILGLGPAIAAILWLKVFKKGRQLNFILLWTLPFLSLVLIYFASNPVFLTEYIRYIPELEMGIALLFGLAVQKVISNFKRKLFIAFSVSLAAIILFAGLFLPGRWEIFATNPDVKNTLEYQIALWAKENAIDDYVNDEVILGRAPWLKQDSRIFLSGSTAFWLPKFAPETWQVRGGIDRSSTNPLWARGSYKIRTAKSLEEALPWFKAMRASFAVVHARNSQEYFHDFSYPDIYAQCSKIDSYGAFRSFGCIQVGGDASDRIIKIFTHLAWSPLKSGLAQFKPVKYGQNDSQYIEKYVKWLEEGKLVLFKKISSGNYLLSLEEGDINRVVDVGIAYDRGWRAKDHNGTKLKTGKDGVGNLVIYPQIMGKQEITLNYKEGWDLYIGIVVSAATLLGLAFVPKVLPAVLKSIEKGWGEESEN